MGYPKSGSEEMTWPSSWLRLVLASVKQMISGLWVRDLLGILLLRGDRELAHCTF